MSTIFQQLSSIATRHASEQAAAKDKARRTVAAVLVACIREGRTADEGELKIIDKASTNPDIGPATLQSLARSIGDIVLAQADVEQARESQKALERLDADFVEAASKLTARAAELGEQMRLGVAKGLLASKDIDPMQAERDGILHTQRERAREHEAAGATHRRHVRAGKEARTKAAAAVAAFPELSQLMAAELEIINEQA